MSQVQKYAYIQTASKHSNVLTPPSNPRWSLFPWQQPVLKVPNFLHCNYWHLFKLKKTQDIYYDLLMGGAWLEIHLSLLIIWWHIKLIVFYASMFHYLFHSALSCLPWPSHCPAWVCKCPLCSADHVPEPRIDRWDTDARGGKTTECCHHAAHQVICHLMSELSSDASYDVSSNVTSVKWCRQVTRNLMLEDVSANIRSTIWCQMCRVVCHLMPRDPSCDVLCWSEGEMASNIIHVMLSGVKWHVV